MPRLITNCHVPDSDRPTVYSAGDLVGRDGMFLSADGNYLAMSTDEGLLYWTIDDPGNLLHVHSDHIDGDLTPDLLHGWMPAPVGTVASWSM